MPPSHTSLTLAVTPRGRLATVSAAQYAQLFGTDPTARVAPRASVRIGAKSLDVTVEQGAPSSVQLSATDLRQLGVDAPTRLPDDVEQTPGCELLGPAGTVTLPHGLYRGRRTATLTCSAAAAVGVLSGEVLALTVVSPPCSATFTHVLASIVDEPARLPAQPAAETVQGGSPPPASDRSHVGLGHGPRVIVALDHDEVGACMLEDAVELRLCRQVEATPAAPFNFVPIYSQGLAANPHREAVRAQESLPRPSLPDAGSGSRTPPSSGVETTWQHGGPEIPQGFHIESSNRHIHLTRADLDTLFGQGFELEPARPLQGIPMWLAKVGQFASKQTVTVRNRTTGAEIRNVRILGPPREYTQVELSHTDARTLGLGVPTRLSSDVVHSAPAILISEDASGGQTAVQLPISEGVIRAARHVHMLYSTAAALGLQHGSLVTVAIESPHCATLLHDVSVRLLENGEGARSWKQTTLRRFAYSVLFPLLVTPFSGRDPGMTTMHVDTDEANAVGLADATAASIYRQDSSGGLSFVGGCALVPSPKPGRVQLRERESARQGAVVPAAKL